MNPPALNTAGLDKFLKSIGRVAAYVDLEANPSVGKDQPPDLAAFVPSAAIVLQEPTEKAATPLAHTQNQQSNSSSATAKPEPAKTVKDNNGVKSSNKNKAAIAKDVKDKADQATAASPKVFANTQLFVDELLDKTSALRLSEITRRQ